MAIKYDLIIMATEKDLSTLKIALPFYKQNLNAGTIYIIASQKIKDKISELEGVEFFDEDTLYPGMNFNAIADIIEEISGERKRAGWYFQQFLKFAWSYRCTGKYYVVIDADTIPLNHIDFMDDNNRYLFTQKIEYNKPYFDTMEKLFAGKIKRCGDFSFVAENMIFDCEYVKELIGFIETNDDLKGTCYWQKILYAVAPESILKSGFSEFETYGNYMLTVHPEATHMRKLRTAREAVYVLGGVPSYDQLIWAGRDYDVISIENPDYGRTLMVKLASVGFVQRHIRFQTLVKTRKKIRTVYRNIRGRNNFEFD